MNKIIECSAVKKDFYEAGLTVSVLKDINLCVHEQEMIAIMGPSGSGKTTLLQILGLLDHPSSGQVIILDKNSSSLNEQELAVLRNYHIGFVYQSHHLLPEFTVLENIMMPLLIRKEDLSIMKERALTLLIAVGLKNKLNNFPYTLSGGERQRVALVRALITQPKCILADEPTGNLDHKNAMLMIDLMQELNKVCKSALVIVTHDPSLAKKMDHLYLLEDGVIRG